MRTKAENEAIERAEIRRSAPTLFDLKNHQNLDTWRRKMNGESLEPVAPVGRRARALLAVLAVADYVIYNLFYTRGVYDRTTVRECRHQRLKRWRKP